MLTAETAILTRLRAALPVETPPINIASSAAVAGTVDIAKLCPLVLVHPARADAESNPPHDLAVETQFWQVIVVVKSLSDVRALQSTYQVAGELMRQAVLALDGYAGLGAGYGFMEYVSRAEPDVAAGLAEFALEFRARYHLHTTPATPTTDAFVTFNEKHNIDPADGEPVAEDNVTLPQ